jgi:cysteine desulfuration protein SufE
MPSSSNFEKKIVLVEQMFAGCFSAEDRYKKILELGHQLPSFDVEQKQACNLVEGCQSLMYAHITFIEGKLDFTVFSEALISKGLAALLYIVYNQQPAEIILKNPPLFLKELGIITSLSPSRASGVASLFSKLQKAAIKFLTTQNLAR